MREIKITEGEMNQRIDKFLLKYLNKAPKSFVFKMLRKKNIKLNDQKVAENYILQNGDKITLFLSDETIDNFKEQSEKLSFSKPIDIVFEDNNILVINKPAGVLSQSNDKATKDDMVKRVSYYLSKDTNFDNDISLGFRPSISNRLDINTSGIIICGKNQSSVISLNNAIKDHKIDKYYYVLVKGTVASAKTLYGYHTKDSETNIVTIEQHKPKNSQSVEVITKYEPLKSSNGYTLLKVTLVTGKSHQIRAHLKSENLFVVGDRKYGDSETNLYFKQKFGLSNQLLHAYEIEFKDMEGNLSYLSNKVITAELPNKFSTIINNLF